MNNLAEARTAAVQGAARIETLASNIEGSALRMFHALQFVERNGSHEDAERMKDAFADALFSLRVALRTLEGYAASSDDVSAALASKAA